MKREINEDILGYQKDFFKGLSLREFVFSVLALIVGIGVMFVLVFFLDAKLNIAVTVGVPIIGAIGLFGFYNKDDMTLIEYIKAKRRVLKSKPLTYATETHCKEKKEKIGIIETVLIKLLK